MPSTEAYNQQHRSVKRQVIHYARQKAIVRQKYDHGEYYIPTSRLNIFKPLKMSGGTKAQDKERDRLNNISLKYTGKSLDEIDEKAILSQEPEQKQTKLKPSRRITPTLISVPDKKDEKHSSPHKQTKPKKRRNTIPCEDGYKIVKAKVKSTNPNDRRKLRGKKLKEIMKSKNMSLIDASRYMKSNNINI